jgi:hypothetical protein
MAQKSGITDTGKDLLLRMHFTPHGHSGESSLEFGINEKTLDVQYAAKILGLCALRLHSFFSPV